MNWTKPADVMASDAYEYIRLKIDMGDLSELNGLSSTGWRVVAIVKEISENANYDYALLERKLEARDGK